MGRPRPSVEARLDLADFRHPDTHSWNWTAHRLLNNALVSVAPEHIGGRLLDVGCGLKPYRPLLAPYITEHVGVDHPESPHALTSVDVLATAYDIPLEDRSFDTILMTEVLEHLERPADAMAEAFRLLRPGGRLILTTPFIWTLHEAPRDFYRFSPFGLRYLAEQAGFAAVAVTPLAGQWTMLALMTGYALGKSPARRLGRGLGCLQRAMQRVAISMDHRWFEPWLAHGHLLVAQRPHQDAPAADPGV
ncbi:MAG TPA: class I SAM-dependent methyltransferase, partial [Solirubrobacteraceae bacterium]|nr:class I SAM-dependent methyltransferase [Solirubrobacteraceae bacterium]